MTRILLTVEYDGTDFFGWQIQPEKRTVQGELEAAFSSLLGEKIILKASGRTDAGVHALAQKAHFDTVSGIPADKLCFAVNVRLPRDVSVRKAEVVPDDFEARFSAKKKTYEYRFYFDKITRPLIDRYAARVPYSKEKFDEKKARRALEKITGTHDFSAFSSTGRPVLDATRTIYRASLVEEKGVFVLSVTGNGFLYNMVRIVAGTIVEIGLGLIDETNVEKALVSPDRTLLGKTYPARGLCLVSVEYTDR